MDETRGGGAEWLSQSHLGGWVSFWVRGSQAPDAGWLAGVHRFGQLEKGWRERRGTDDLTTQTPEEGKPTPRSSARGGERVPPGQCLLNQGSHATNHVVHHHKVW